MSDSRPLASKVALVTGSSTGIGMATATELSRQGATIILHGRSHTRDLKSAADQIRELGGASKTLACDFSQTDGLPSFSDEAWAQFGVIDILVNNAGGDVLTGEFSNLEFTEQLEYLWRVDVVATLLLSRSIGKKMQDCASAKSTANGNMAIVNIGWDQAEYGMAGDSGEMFATTKGAVMSMTRSLAQSLAPMVRVNCVAPGWIKTQWGEEAPQKWATRAVDESLMNRWGCPDDVSQTIAFLVGPGASFVSGQIIPVNGGFNFSQGLNN